VPFRLLERQFVIAHTSAGSFQKTAPRIHGENASVATLLGLILELNLRVALRFRIDPIALWCRTCLSVRFYPRARPSGDDIPLGGLVANVEAEVNVNGYDILQSFTRHRGGGWTDVWHLWTIMIPRRSITGRLLWGKVWRRHDGRRWIYKKFAEYADSDS
jgi:hypothetical protein